jgi:hypothetical protein
MPLPPILREGQVRERRPRADAAESAQKSAWMQDSLACADVGIDPGSPVFSQCVADLHHSLWAAQNQNLAN